jgi:protein gp37
VTAIEWTDNTWNPVTGCTRVSPGCAHCYIERQTPMRIARRRFHREGNESTTGVQPHPDRLTRIPKGPRIFVCSMSDLFHEEVSFGYLADVFAAMRHASDRTFQVLTKRPERMAQFVSLWRNDKPEPEPNIWLGVTVENARYADRVDVLREIPAAVRFISAEPLLGPLVDRASCGSCWDWPDPDCSECDGLLWWWTYESLNLDGIDWLIVGGESGPGHRPMDPQWARDLRDYGHASDVAFFFKQWGGKTPKSGGRLLDGREWSEFPVRLLPGEAASPTGRAEH